MMLPHSLKDADRERIILAYQRGERSADIAARERISQQTVYRVIRGKVPLQRVQHSQELVASAASLYQSGLGTRAVAEKLNISRQRVRSLVESVGVAAHEAGDRPLDVNHNFFGSIDTQEKAYWLGFLATDGCVTDDGHVTIGLAIIDQGHLSKFRQAVESERAISVTNEGKACNFSFLSRQMAKDLVKHTIVPRKTFTVQPSILRDDLQRHYWRGAIDGDGHITQGHPGIEVGFAGNLAMVTGFAAWSSAVCGSTARVRPMGNIFRYTVSGRKMPPILLRALYHRAYIYLDRKYAKYLDAVAV